MSANLPLGEFGFHSIEALSSLLREQHVTAVELASTVLADLDQLGRSLHAVAELTTERALNAARAADVRLRAGERGRLLGIPYGAKDVIATAGIPTRWGSPAHADQVPDADALVIEQLDAAGAVLVAKLSTIELAGAGGYRSPTASIDGATQNPWDRDYWAGGSSSGPASAVSAGIVPFALGTDTGGSIAIPAAFVGVAGLRPTHGSVSTTGVMPVARSLDAVGPLARGLDDIESVMTVLTTHAPAEPMQTRPRPTIGLLGNPAIDNAEVERVFREAAETFEGFADLIPVEPPPFDYMGIHRAVMNGECAIHHRAFIASERIHQLVDAAQVESLQAIASAPRDAYREAQTERREIIRAFGRIFANVDVLAGAASTREALRLEEDIAQNRGAWLHTRPAPLAGLPSLTIPVGFGPHDLPLGLSLIGPRGSEPILFDIAGRYQQLTDWNSKRPPIAGTERRV